VISLSLVQANQDTARARLEEELRIAEEELARLGGPAATQEQAALANRLQAVLSGVSSLATGLAAPADTIDINEELFIIARRSSVVLREVTALPLTSGELAGVECAVQPLTVSVEGSLDNLLGFVSRLNIDLQNALVRSVDISVADAATGEGASASVELLVYSYQGQIINQAD